MQEEWKTIENYSRYKVSNLGKVWDTKTDLEVSQVLTGEPQYYYVNLNRDDGKRKLERVHRLVAKAFVEGWSEEFNVVDHKDRDKLNNIYTNLRWTDRSGNLRNQGSSVWIDDVHLKDFVEKYENPLAAYQHFLLSISNGLSIEEAIDRYEKYLEYGLKQVKVRWNGQEVFLLDLCKSKNRDYDVVRENISKGWDVWNSLYCVPVIYPYSVEIPSSKVTGYWFKCPKYLIEEMPYGRKSIMSMVDEGATYEEILAYDSLDHYRQTISGVTGTIDELCVAFGKTFSSVHSRMQRGMTLEQALTEDIKRVKKVKINGVARSPKHWFEYFKLDYRKVKRYRDKTKCSFEEALKTFGIDTSGMMIEYGD